MTSLKNVIVIAAFGLLITGGRAHAATYTAASCSQSAVQSAINQHLANAQDGDVIVIPAGSCTWTGTTIVSANFTKSVTIQGAGAMSSTDRGAGTSGSDQTVIIDNLNRPNTTIDLSIAAGKTLRITDLAIRQNASSLAVNNGILNVGGSGVFRMDHCHQYLTKQTIGTWIGGALTGVVDHNYFEAAPGLLTNDIGFHNGANWNGDTAGYGDKSWADADHWGTSQFIFAEDNRFLNGDPSDSSTGGRFVFRYNTVTVGSASGGGGQMFNHGLTPGRDRGMRAAELYQNTFAYPSTGNQPTFSVNAGSLLYWGNTITNYYPGAVYMDYQRFGDAYPGGWGNPPSGWGICTGTAGTVWDGAGGYPCMDAPARGAGDLLTGGTVSGALNSATGTKTWLRQILSPMYIWGNTYSGVGTLIVNGAPSALIQQNRDYYQQTASFNGTAGVGQGLLSARPATCTAGPGGNTPGVGYWATDTNTLYVCTATNSWTVYYRPYTYPHPLTTSALPPTVITAASCALSDVAGAIASATAGGTVQVPACSATWSSTLSISKNISLIGAGIGNTVITGGASPMINYNPVNNTALFRISGFTFNANNTQVIQLNNNSIFPPVYQVRIDHNRFTGSTSLGGGGIENFGVRGVVDNNTFDNMRGGSRAWGDNSGVGAFDWSHYPPLVFGAANDNFYYEDNTFNLTSGAYMVSDCDQGGRFAYRYNSFNSATDMYPWLDYHGGRGSTFSCFSGEVYGNTYSRSGFMVSWRGGRIAFFNNSQASGSGSFNVYNNDGCPSTTPQRHNNGYSWGSRSGTSGALVGSSSSGGDVCGDVVLNSTYWLDNTSCQAPQTCTSITSGVGCGTPANRPTSCTTGTAYWATNQSCSNLTGMVGPNPATPISGTLYQCTSPNTWTAFFTPLTYPHPLRNAGSPPTDTSAPSVPSNLTASAVSSSQINLTWTASTDNVGVTGYRILRGGTQVGTSATTSFSNTGLTPSTAYSYTVTAVDAAGNVSAPSAAAGGTTLAPPSTGVPWAGILDPSRAIDWQQAGIPGGIPNRNTVCATLASPGVSTDATALIQNALNACPAGQVVLLNAGTFRINSSLRIPSHKTLRGSGADKTRLDMRGGGQSAIYFGSQSMPSPSSFIAITGGATPGSTSITVNGSAIAAGDMVMINSNDTSYMTPQGNAQRCDWCAGDFPGHSGQTVEVLNVSGSVVTFRPALYFDYSSLAPKAYRYSPGAKSAGLENLEIYANNTGYETMIEMWGSLYCWMTGVEVDFADEAHMQILHSLGNVVRNNFFHDGFDHGAGTSDNQLNLARKSSANLIENNIFWRQHVSIMLEWGASGNVVAYNYLTGNYHHPDLDWQIADINFHGAHPFFNLFEGNIGDSFIPDDYWGSSSHSTLFRNYSTGARQYIPPMNARGTLQTAGAIWQDQNNYAYDINEFNTYTNFIGSIAGSAHMAANGAAAWKVSPESGFNNNVCIRFGYDANNFSPGGPNLAYSTAFIHGVNDCQTGTFRWNSGTTQALPASFYLSGKPAFFGTAPWPGIGPDIVGASGYQGRVQPNPAQRCFNLTTSNGTSNTGAFNPDACYASGLVDTKSPSAPKGLRLP